MPHTILLIQPARGHETRTYTDYETVQLCLEGRPSQSLSYFLSDLAAYLGVMLVLVPESGTETRVMLAGIKTTHRMCKIYEEHLRQMNPHSPSITYDISDLFKFIDNLFDLSCLVHQSSTNTYVPHNKEWLKEKIYGMLKRQANSKQ